MKKKEKKPLGEVFKNEDGSQVLFFMMPLEYQMHMRDMTPPEKDLFVYFMTQIYYEHSLELEKDYEDIMFWTGLKRKETIANAIEGLARKGWIKNIIWQQKASNIYHINLSPKVNPSLLERMERRSENTSRAKKESIAKGEKGKFTGVGAA